MNFLTPDFLLSQIAEEGLGYGQLFIAEWY